ncbi:hypothetical protein BSLA_02f1243 [Burkholderia stabilis]|nr:hypothetical protein BSLA_02f1243 [Burkholderia stabilis]
MVNDSGRDVEWLVVADCCQMWPAVADPKRLADRAVSGHLHRHTLSTKIPDQLQLEGE